MHHLLNFFVSKIKQTLGSELDYCGRLYGSEIFPFFHVR